MKDGTFQNNNSTGLWLWVKTNTQWLSMLRLAGQSALNEVQYCAKINLVMLMLV